MFAWRGFALWLAAMLAWQTAAQAQAIIPEPVLERHGLTRAWRSQIELNRAIDRIAYITQFDGVLYLQTSHATVHALNAETGKKIWSTQIGRTEQMSLAPGVNQDYLAVINGSTLHVVDRKTGREKFDRVLSAVPGTGPAVSDTTVFVSMVNGLIQGFNLTDQRQLPWVHRSIGRISTQPIITGGSMAWTTNKGYFYLADVDPPKVRLRIETRAEITSRPAYWTPYLYACSTSGFLYAMNEETGQTVWKFPAGFSLSRQPAAVNGVVYITLDSGGMFAIDGQTGEQRWFSPNIAQFCCVSGSRLYAIDNLDRLAILDLQRGTRVATLPIGEMQFKLVNQQTDRLYLVSNEGTVQCLHEIGQQKPLLYEPPVLKRRGSHPEDEKPDKAKAEDSAKTDDAAAGEMPADDATDKAGEDATGEEGEGDAMPAEEDETDSKNPFSQ